MEALMSHREGHYSRRWGFLSDRILYSGPRSMSVVVAAQRVEGFLLHFGPLELRLSHDLVGTRWSASIHRRAFSHSPSFTNVFTGGPAMNATHLAQMPLRTEAAEVGVVRFQVSGAVGGVPAVLAQDTLSSHCSCPRRAYPIRGAKGTGVRAAQQRRKLIAIKTWAPMDAVIADSIS